jgi:hypothetical protein
MSFFARIEQTVQTRFPKHKLVVNSQGLPIVERRLDLTTQELTDDQYFVMTDDENFMNIRTRGLDVIEVYPSNHEKPFEGWPHVELMYKDALNDLSVSTPYYSEDWRTGVRTHFYGVLRDSPATRRLISSSSLDAESQCCIVRFNAEQEIDRFYGYSSAPMHEADYHVTYYPAVMIDGCPRPSPAPIAMILGFSPDNPQYRARLIEYGTT